MCVCVNAYVCVHTSKNSKRGREEGEREYLINLHFCHLIYSPLFLIFQTTLLDMFSSWNMPFWRSFRVHLLALDSPSCLFFALLRTPKGCGFDSPWGHVPRLWSQCIREATNRYFYLTSMFLALPSSLSKINKHILGLALKFFKRENKLQIRWKGA